MLFLFSGSKGLLRFRADSVGAGSCLRPKAALSLLFAVITTFAIGSSFAQAQNQPLDETAADNLPRGTVKKLDELIVPAMKANRNDVFMASITPIIERSDRDQLKSIEAYCFAQGAGSVRERFGNLALLQIEQGLVRIDTKHDLTLAVYLADELANKVEKGLAKLQQHDVMSDPLEVPDDWQHSEQLFWETHVYRNEFVNAQNLVDYGVAVLKPHFRRANKSGDAEMLSVFERVDKLAKVLPQTYQSMVEREAEMRLIRFSRSHKKLMAGGDFETLLVAAMCVELDSEKLNELFQHSSPDSLTRAALKDPTLPKTVHQMVRQARQVEDNISHKAILLRSGLHYWLRGRYGEGQLAGGLLKAPEAMTSALAMEGLYMPKIRPKPISRYHDIETSEPGYDRRHYYTWAVEHRPLIEERNSYSRSRNERDITSARTTRKFW